MRLLFCLQPLKSTAPSCTPYAQLGVLVNPLDIKSLIIMCYARSTTMPNGFRNWRPCQDCAVVAKSSMLRTPRSTSFQRPAILHAYCHDTHLSRFADETGLANGRRMLYQSRQNSFVV